MHRQLTAAAVATLVSSAAMAAMSTFDSDADGWTAIDFPGSGNYSAVNGNFTPSWNSAGHISHSDGSSFSFFFSAPGKFLGDQSIHLGGELKFDLRTTHDSWNQDTVVVFKGAGLTIVAPIAQPTPLNQFVSYTLPLVHTGFRLNNAAGVTPTEAQFASVMADLTLLAIPGEFANGLVETTSLDNVILPEPATLGAMSMALLLLRRRR